MQALSRNMTGPAERCSDLTCRRAPLSPICAARSEPARSTKFKRDSLRADALPVPPPVFVGSIPFSIPYEQQLPPTCALRAPPLTAARPAAMLSRLSVCSTTTVNTACERELTSLILVAAVARARWPRAASAQTSDGLRTVTSVIPSTKTPR
eukprot:scaffold69689_cov21-Tisochrysis_lutea.AAC.2